MRMKYTGGRAQQEKGRRKTKIFVPEGKILNRLVGGKHEYK